MQRIWLNKCLIYDVFSSQFLKSSDSCQNLSFVHLFTQYILIDLLYLLHFKWEDIWLKMFVSSLRDAAYLPLGAVRVQSVQQMRIYKIKVLILHFL